MSEKKIKNVKKRGFYWSAVVCSRCGAGPPGGRGIDFRTFYLSLFTFQLVMCRIVSWGFVFFFTRRVLFLHVWTVEVNLNFHVTSVAWWKHTRGAFTVFVLMTRHNRKYRQSETESVFLCVWLPLWHTHTHTLRAVWWWQVSLSAHYLWQRWSLCLESNKTHLSGDTEMERRGGRGGGREGGKKKQNTPPTSKIYVL